MSYELKVIAFTANETKKITSASSKVTMGASAMFYSASAGALTIDEVFTNSDLEWLVIQRGAYVEMKFTADSGGSNGQGIRIPQGLSKVEITEVFGTVKRLTTLNQNQADTKTDAYSDGSATSVSTDEEVDAGDYVVCNSSGHFKVKFTAHDYPSEPFVAIAFGLLADSTR